MVSRIFTTYRHPPRDQDRQIDLVGMRMMTSVDRAAYHVDCSAVDDYYSHSPLTYPSADLHGTVADVQSLVLVPSTSRSQYP